MGGGGGGAILYFSSYFRFRASFALAAVLGMRIRSLIRTHVFGPPGSGSISQAWTRIWILPFSHKDAERTEILLEK